MVVKYNSTVRVGVGVIIEKDGKVLLGLRTSKHGQGTWGFPGGHLEIGETPEDCALRECEEEIGISVINTRRYTYTNDIFVESGKHYITLFMKADMPEGAKIKNMEPHKCERWEWFSAQDLPEPLMVPITNLLKDGYSLTDHPPTKKVA